MNPLWGMLAGPLVLVLVLALCHVSDRRHERKSAIEAAERSAAVNAAWERVGDPLLREAEREVDAMLPGTPRIGDGLRAGMTAEDRAISTRFTAAMLAKGTDRARMLDSLVPPDAKAAGVYPDECSLACAARGHRRLPAPLPPPRFDLFEKIEKW